MDESKKTTLGRDTLLFLPAKILEGLIGIFCLSLMTRVITPDGVDSFGTVNTVVSFSYLLLISYLTNSAARYLGDETRDALSKRRFYSSVGLIWLITALFGAAAALIVFVSSRNAYAIAACAMFTSYSVYQLTLALLVQAGKKKHSVILALSAAALKPALILAIHYIWSISTAPAVFVAYVAAELASGAAGLVILGVPHSFSVKGFSKILFKKFLSYGLPLMGVSLSVGLLNFVDRFIIILGGEDFGVYYTNNAISSSVFTMLMIGIMRAVYPNVLKSYREGGIKTAGIVINKGARLFLLVAAPAAAGLCGVGHSLAAALFEESYVWGYTVIGLSAVAMLFTGLTEYAIKTWELSGNTRPVMENALIAMVIKVAASLILLPGFGINGAAAGSVIAFAAYFIISCLRARKTFLFKIGARHIFNILLSSALCFAASNAATRLAGGKFLSLALGIVAGVIVYGVAIVLTGEVKEEIALIKAKLKR